MFLCAVKRCYHIVAPTLWENVRVTSDRLLASTSVPNHITFARYLHLDLFKITMSEEDEREFAEKLVALLKLSSPTTLNLLGCSEVSIVVNAMPCNCFWADWPGEFEHWTPMTGVIIFFNSVCKKEITKFWNLNLTISPWIKETFPSWNFNRHPTSDRRNIILPLHEPEISQNIEKFFKKTRI